MGFLADAYNSVFGGSDPADNPTPQINMDQTNQWVGQSSQARTAEQGAQSEAMNRALGKGPSVAVEEAKQATDAANAQASAMASSGMGTKGQAMAQRQAMMQQGANAQQLGRTAALARVHEQSQNLGLAGQLAGQMRGQDLGTAQMYGQLSAAQAGLQAQNQGLQAWEKEQQAGHAEDMGQRLAGLAQGIISPGTGGSGADLDIGGGVHAADFDLSEPYRGMPKQAQGPAHWTLREEPNFILAVNRLTGEMHKLATQPLSEEEKRQALGPHGAGGINAPNRMHTTMHDAQMGAASPSGFQPTQPDTNPNPSPELLSQMRSANPAFMGGPGMSREEAGRTDASGQPAVPGYTPPTEPMNSTRADPWKDADKLATQAGAAPQANAPATSHEARRQERVQKYPGLYKPSITDRLLGGAFGFFGAQQGVQGGAAPGELVAGNPDAAEWQSEVDRRRMSGDPRWRFMQSQGAEHFVPTPEMMAGTAPPPTQPEGESNESVSSEENPRTWAAYPEEWRDAQGKKAPDMDLRRGKRGMAYDGEMGGEGGDASEGAKSAGSQGGGPGAALGKAFASQGASIRAGLGGPPMQSMPQIAPTNFAADADMDARRQAKNLYSGAMFDISGIRGAHGLDAPDQRQTSVRNRPMMGAPPMGYRRPPTTSDEPMPGTGHVRGYSPLSAPLSVEPGMSPADYPKEENRAYSASDADMKRPSFDDLIEQTNALQRQVDALRSGALVRMPEEHISSSRSLAGKGPQTMQEGVNWASEALRAQPRVRESPVNYPPIRVPISSEQTDRYYEAHPVLDQMPDLNYGPPPPPQELPEGTYPAGYAASYKPGDPVDIDQWSPPLPPSRGGGIAAMMPVPGAARVKDTPRGYLNPGNMYQGLYDPRNPYEATPKRGESAVKEAPSYKPSARARTSMANEEALSKRYPDLATSKKTGTSGK